MKQFIFISLLALASCAHHNDLVTPAQVAATAPVILENPKTLEEAVLSPYRTESMKARDKYRHPLDTLTFFGVKPSMKVIEIIPGTGFYTEILAPLLNDKGHYTVASRAAAPNEPSSNNVADWSKKYSDIAKNISTTAFDLSNPNFELGDAGSVDMVLTFRNVHNWMAKGNEDVAFKAFYKVLKKNGILGVVEHRAPEDRTDPKAATGYVRESDVIKMAKKAGFKYVGKSEVNSNLKDTKDYEKGVWTLPPTFALKDQDREKYKAIGESDRMTLKFIKK